MPAQTMPKKKVPDNIRDAVRLISAVMMRMKHA